MTRHLVFVFKLVLKLLMPVIAALVVVGFIAPSAHATVPQAPAPMMVQATYSVPSTSATIAAAAQAQVGAPQDCTMLVTNALAAAGISFHDWPSGYASLGYAVSPSQAVPGDLLIYYNGGNGLDHVAVYAGNGQAVHGGWNGYQTVNFSVNTNSGAPDAYIRVAGGSPVYSVPDPVVEADPVFELASANISAGSGTHVVAAGETLSSIAQAYGLGSWQQLWDANPHLSNPDLIYVGQTLAVP